MWKEKVSIWTTTTLCGTCRKTWVVVPIILYLNCVVRRRPPPGWNSLCCLPGDSIDFVVVVFHFPLIRFGIARDVCRPNFSREKRFCSLTECVTAMQTGLTSLSLSPIDVFFYIFLYFCSFPDLLEEKTICAASTLLRDSCGENFRFS
jgi:hypothetical protein